MEWSRNLVESLSCFQRLGYLCDMDLIAADGTVFSAHSCVMASSSRVLKAAISLWASKLQQDPKAHQDRLLVKTTISSALLPSVIQCIYTGNIKVESEQLTQVHSALAELDVNDPSLLSAEDQEPPQAGDKLRESTTEFSEVLAEGLREASTGVQVKAEEDRTRRVKRTPDGQLHAVGQTNSLLKVNVVDEGNDEESNSELAPASPALEEQAADEAEALQTSPTLPKEALAHSPWRSPRNRGSAVTRTKPENVEFKRREDGLWPCPQCERVCADKSKVMAHYRIHTNERPFPCQDCDKSFRDKSTLTRHTQSVHLRLKPHRCQFCPKAFSELTKLKVHQAREHCSQTAQEEETAEDQEAKEAKPAKLTKGEDGMWHCPHCAKSFHYSYQVKRHAKTHEAEERFPCQECDKVFSQKFTLNRHHQVVHEKRRPHKCEKCGKTFAERSKLKHHFLRLHEPDSEQGRQLLAASKVRRTTSAANLAIGNFTCEECGKAFRLRYQLLRHKAIHSDRKPHQCDHCGKAFRQGSQLTRHVRSVHMGLRPFKCTLCPKTFKERSKLKDHLNIHGNVNVYQCTHCPKKFSGRSGLWRHKLTVHVDTKPHHCQVCNKAFKLRSQVKVHEKFVHKGIKNHACSYCMKFFSSKTLKEVHERTHTGASPYLCQHCCKEFKQAGALTIHIRRHHTGERPYPCRYCGKAYVTSHERKVHESIHLGSKEYQCPTCGKSFPGSANLHMHSLTHKTARPHTCDICSKAYKTKSHLQRHVKTSHQTLLTQEDDGHVVVLVQDAADGTISVQHVQLQS